MSSCEARSSALLGSFIMYGWSPSVQDKLVLKHKYLWFVSISKKLLKKVRAIQFV